ncbi:MAG TPA: chemotaxis protein CheX [Polyangiaceae bacterium]|nr:chemotaxis protein CheX [Polyangiaceae bacterium]
MTTTTSVSPNSTETPTTSLMVLGEALRVSCVELMQNYGIEARPRGPEAASEAPVAVLVAGVDFKGRELRGTVALWAAQSVLRETTRKAPGLGENAPLQDWTCELTNQLAGRMKNKLRPYGVSLHVNVPRLLHGSDVTELETGLQHRFSCDFGSLSAYLDVLIAPGFVLTEGEPTEPLKQEGDFTVF